MPQTGARSLEFNQYPPQPAAPYNAQYGAPYNPQYHHEYNQQYQQYAPQYGQQHAQQYGAPPPVGVPATGLNRDYYAPPQPNHSHTAAAAAGGVAGGLALGGGAVLAYDALNDLPTGHPSHPSTIVNRDVDVTVINERPGYAAGPGWEQPYYQGGDVEIIETRQVDAFGNYTDTETTETVEAERDAFGNIIEYETGAFFYDRFLVLLLESLSLSSSVFQEYTELCYLLSIFNYIAPRNCLIHRIKG